MDKNTVIAQNMEALARRRGGKKKGNLRSQMLRMIMPMLSRENGDKLANAIQKRDVSALQSVWDDIKSQLTDKLEVKASADVPEGLKDMDIHQMYRSLVMDITNTLEADESLSFNDDYSRLLVGSARIPKLTREFAANGRLELENESGILFILTITNVTVPPNSNLYKNPKMTVRSELHTQGEKARLLEIENKDAYAAACSEIVVSALSIIEQYT